MILQLILASYFISGAMIAITAALAAQNDVWEQYTLVGFFSIVLVWLPMFALALIEIHYDHNY